MQILKPISVNMIQTIYTTDVVDSHKLLHKLQLARDANCNSLSSGGNPDAVQ